LHQPTFFYFQKYAEKHESLGICFSAYWMERKFYGEIFSLVNFWLEKSCVFSIWLHVISLYMICWDCCITVLRNWSSVVFYSLDNNLTISYVSYGTNSWNWLGTDYIILCFFINYIKIIIIHEINIIIYKSTNQLILQIYSKPVIN